MALATTTHIDDLLKAGDGDAGGRDLVISQSWRRCLDEYRLDPVAPRRAYIHTNQRLREHRDAMDDLIRVARFGVESLYRQVSGLGYVLILSDAKGVAVDFIGDPSHDEALRRAGLYRGSDWSERLAGTCAVGTCITTGEALTVHLDDHFAGDHIGLTCTAAPIYSADGNLAAVLDISALRSPLPKTSQFLALQTVRSFAHRIETASLHNGFRRDWIVHLSRSREFADIEPDLAIAIDSSGRILGFNSQARRLVDTILSGSGHRFDLAGPHRGLGLSFGDLFEASVDDLPKLTRSKPVDQRVLRLRSGEAFFALALEPTRAGQSPSSPIAGRSSPISFAETRDTAVVARPDDGAGVDMLLGFDRNQTQHSEGDPALRAALDRAAASLRAGIPVLIQGETGTGKEALARALHRMVAFDDERFLKIDCGAFADPYYEHALFGVGNDAFRDAQNGTLFLDGLNSLPLPIQARLMSLFEPAHADGQRRTIRVISAATETLAQDVSAGRVRADLYYRVKGATLRLPALRDRPDKLTLIIHVLRKMNPVVTLSADALAALLAYPWPGNVRELHSVLKVALAAGRDDLIRAADLDLPSEPTLTAGNRATDKDTLETAERTVILQHLQKHNSNVAKTAEALSMSRATLYRKIKHHRL